MDEGAVSRLAAIVESSDDAIVGKTLEGIVTSWNPGAERLFGYSAAEMLGRPVGVLVPPDRREEEAAILQCLARGQRVAPFETVRRCKDGRLVEVSVAVSPVYGADGRLLGASKIARDISERKQAQGRLQAQLARLQLLDHVTCAIGGHQDIDSIYQVAVHSIEERMPLDFGAVGYLSKDRTCLELTYIGARGWSFITDVAPGGDRQVPIVPEGVGRCANGTLVYEPDAALVSLPFARRMAHAGLRSLVLSPLHGDQEVFAVLIAARSQPSAFSSIDCEFLRQLSAHLALATRQAELVASLRQACDDLHRTQQITLKQERMRALGQMASGVAHDIGNLLVPALHYGQQLLDDETTLSEVGRLRLAAVVQAVQDVAELTGRLKDFYRSREVRPTMSLFSLNDLVPQVVSISRARWSDMARHQGVKIEVRTELGDAPMAHGSESEIREALLNLLLNAVDAMPQGGVLRLETGRTPAASAMTGTAEAGAFVRVSDNGVGMDEETLNRCLDPLFTTKGDQGTGMGLAMVHSTAQRHQAHLSIESRPGAGTSVTLRFPPAPSGEAVPASTQPLAQAMSVGLRVLVVDDDPMVLDTLATMLRATGQQVTAAKGGASGVDEVLSAQAAGTPFDVVFTDLGMPGVDGRAVAGAVRQASPSTAVVLLTGWGEAGNGAADERKVFDLVMAKPPRLSDLRDALARCGGPARAGSARTV